MPRKIRPLVFLAVALCGAAPAMAFAQCADTRAERPLLLAGARYDAPLRVSGSVGVLVPLGPLTYGDPGCDVPAYRGVLADVSLGTGGRRLSVGVGRRVKAKGQPVLFGQDVLVSWIRTASSPRRASPDSTYIGIEAGVTILAMRFSVGLAHRGAEGSQATVFVWSVGVHTGW